MSRLQVAVCQLDIVLLGHGCGGMAQQPTDVGDGAASAMQGGCQVAAQAVYGDGV